MLCPKIKIVNEILDHRANQINEICPVKVFSFDKIAFNQKKRLLVAYPQFCTLCKECLRSETNIKNPIRISRVKNKLNFIIESTGVLSPEILFHRAISLLVGKCNNSLSTLFKSFKLAEAY